MRTREFTRKNSFTTCSGVYHVNEVTTPALDDKNVKIYGSNNLLNL
jgi:hypothetical protein